MTFRLLWLLALLTLAAPAAAQNASLLADRVEIVGDETIIASGQVEVLYRDSRLRAQRITYDAKAGTLIIEGPIVLEEGKSTVILADMAELDADLQNGILRGARMVLDQQLQVAATEIQRVDGRYSQLYQTVASSCQICANRPVPLWQIRAKRVIHDEEARQLYFHNAQFRIGNVPVAYFPRLRMPDPTVDRYTGVLAPKIVDSSRVGTGLKLPYFITLGDHADVTLTPFVTPDSRTMEARYRQAFRYGDIELNSAFTKDKLENDPRAYLFGTGQFRLPRDYKLRFDFELTTDPTYLLEYGYSGKDRLENQIELSRTRRDAYFEAALLNFKTLRGSELPVESQLPNFQGSLLYERRLRPAGIGGDGSWQINLDTHKRQSDVDMEGRDVTRLGAEAQWQRSTILANGMVGKIGGRLNADLFRIAQDSAYDPYLTHVTPALEAELRWPFMRTEASGATQVLEPVIHLAWTNTLGAKVPNESSTLVEFDEGNLYALSRFPGHDRYERGFRATLGANWTRIDPSGWSWGLTAGRVFRADDLGQFSNASGLDGRFSDWLIGTQVKMDQRLSVDARMLLAPDFTVAKAEARINWSGDRFGLTSSYSRIVADPDENRPDLNSQIQLQGRYDITRHWQSNFDLRYDVTAREATRAALGLIYRNECVNLDLSLSRRFTSSSNVAPTTNIGFSVGLNGFGTDGRRYRRSCSG
ncbi:MAG: LPS assembly protein LptD [Paracoccaceae bacterium]